MLRNPVHNLSLAMGFNGTAISKKVSGNPLVTDDPFEENTGLLKIVVKDSNNKEYQMWYYCKLWRQILPFYKGDIGIRLLIGYKNFNIKELNKEYHYSMTIAFTPFKMFIKG